MEKGKDTVMSVTGRKQIRKEDVGKIREFAEKLNAERSPKKRMDMQQEVVREMGEKYGHETATMILTKVWVVANKLKWEKELYA